MDFPFCFRFRFLSHDCHEIYTKTVTLPAEETPGLTADDRVSYEKSMNDLEKVMATLSQPKLERPSQISELIHRRRNRVLVYFIS